MLRHCHTSGKTRSACHRRQQAQREKGANGNFPDPERTGVAAISLRAIRCRSGRPTRSYRPLSVPLITAPGIEAASEFITCFTSAGSARTFGDANAMTLCHERLYAHCLSAVPVPLYTAGARSLNFIAIAVI